MAERRVFVGVLQLFLLREQRLCRRVPPLVSRAHRVQLPLPRRACVPVLQLLEAAVEGRKVELHPLLRLFRLRIRFLSVILEVSGDVKKRVPHLLGHQGRHALGIFLPGRLVRELQGSPVALVKLVGKRRGFQVLRQGADQPPVGPVLLAVVGRGFAEALGGLLISPFVQRLLAFPQKLQILPHQIGGAVLAAEHPVDLCHDPVLEIASLTGDRLQGLQLQRQILRAHSPEDGQQLSARVLPAVG